MKKLIKARTNKSCWKVDLFFDKDEGKILAHVDHQANCVARSAKIDDLELHNIFLDLESYKLYNFWLNNFELGFDKWQQKYLKLNKKLKAI